MSRLLGGLASALSAHPIERAISMARCGDGLLPATRMTQANSGRDTFSRASAVTSGASRKNGLPRSSSTARMMLSAHGCRTGSISTCSAPASPSARSDSAAPTPVSGSTLSRLRTRSGSMNSSESPNSTTTECPPLLRLQQCSRAPSSFDTAASGKCARSCCVSVDRSEAAQAIWTETAAGVPRTSKLTGHESRGRARKNCSTASGETSRSAGRESRNSVSSTPGGSESGSDSPNSRTGKSESLAEPPLVDTPPRSRLVSRLKNVGRRPSSISSCRAGAQWNPNGTNGGSSSTGKSQVCQPRPRRSQA